MTRWKVADLTSGIGALVLGVRLGALFSPLFAPAAGRFSGSMNKRSKSSC